jgi:hypothetical protein
MSYAAEFSFLKSTEFCRNGKRFMTRAEARIEAKNIKKDNAGSISRTRVVRTYDQVNYRYAGGRLTRTDLATRKKH